MIMMYNIINIININVKYKKKKILIPLYKFDLQLIKLLINLNIVKYIKLNNNNIYAIYLNTHKNYSIKNLYKPSRQIYINLKQIYKLTLKKKWIIIISTNKGLLNNFEAIKKKTGGVIIAIIQNQKNY